jgi:hypothetical protein
MRTATKLAALAPVTVGVLALSEAHYLIRHFTTLAELGAAVTVGAAIWVRTARKSAEAPERATEPVTDVSYTVQALPPPARVAYPMSEEVARHISR